MAAQSAAGRVHVVPVQCHFPAYRLSLLTLACVRLLFGVF